MDPITAALAAGATAGLTGVATQAIRDAYGQLKAALTTRLPQLSVDVQALEARPGSKAKQASLAEDLAEVGADRDMQLHALARALAEAIQSEAPQAAVSVGVDLERVRAASLTIEEARGGNTGVRGQDWDVSGDIHIGTAQGGTRSDLAGTPVPATVPTIGLDRIQTGRDLNLSTILIAGATATGTSPGESARLRGSRVLTLLENRRVLFDPVDVEQPESCVNSVMEMRAFLQDELAQIDRQSLLAACLRDMVGVCRHFLTRTQQPGLIADAGRRTRWAIGAWVFDEALGELRGQFGILIGQLAATHGLNVTGPLANIVPEADS